MAKSIKAVVRLDAELRIGQFYVEMANGMQLRETELRANTDLSPWKQIMQLSAAGVAVKRLAILDAQGEVVAECPRSDWFWSCRGVRGITTPAGPRLYHRGTGQRCGRSECRSQRMSLRWWLVQPGSCASHPKPPTKSCGVLRREM